MTGFKVTDKEGYAFYTRSEAYRLEVGKTVKEHCLQTGLLANPNNPDRLKVGDRVVSREWGSLGHSFFHKHPSATVTAIDPDALRATVTAEGTGETATIHFHFLRKASNPAKPDGEKQHE